MTGKENKALIMLSIFPSLTILFACSENFVPNYQLSYCYTPRFSFSDYKIQILPSKYNYQSYLNLILCLSGFNVYRQVFPTQLDHMFFLYILKMNKKILRVVLLTCFSKYYMESQRQNLGYLTFFSCFVESFFSLISLRIKEIL